MGKNRDIKTQMNRLQHILEAHPYLGAILTRADDICLPNWYIAAGCIPTIVWNALSGYEKSKHLNDIDLVYYDPDDLSRTGEEKCQHHVAALYSDIPVRIEIINQARVHLWYEQHFERSIAPCHSAEAGINTWLSVTAVGVRKQQGQFQVYAPYGLNDLFTMTVRPNALLITEEHYRKKCTQWSRQWPGVTVLPWQKQNTVSVAANGEPTTTAWNTDMATQISTLEAIRHRNPLLHQVLEQTNKLLLPEWYLGGGCLAQTVWNLLSGFDPTAHITDLDLAYYDPHDLSYDRENWHIQQVCKAFQHLPIPVDVKNQARVHLWYEQHFGHPIQAYGSTEEAINHWPTTSTCVGVTIHDAQFSVYAPYGLNDLFGMIVRPNKRQITEEIYCKKTARWKRCWPGLHIMPW
ncbi:MAG: nucleotidyltransferase family protein [Desulfobacteraceae bacterium]|nr:MAG: nucleotidyltransferase family protein [Desulfobacteraceae bacterium]